MRAVSQQGCLGFHMMRTLGQCKLARQVNTKRNANSIQPRGTLQKLNKRFDMKDKYKLIGPAYDFLSNLYAGKSIMQCKKSMLTLENLNKGDKVLFAGAGHGKDAIHAAQLGMDVTIVELSETMLRKFQEGVDASPTPIKIRKIHGDILKFEEFEEFDMVVANFFLNVFSEDMMNQVLTHLVKMVKPGGKMVVGDFEPPSGNIVKRGFQSIYWYSAVSAFCLITRNAMHKVYRYPQHMQSLGLSINDTRHYSLLGLNLYWSIMGEKPQATAEKAA